MLVFHHIVRVPVMNKSEFLSKLIRNFIKPKTMKNNITPDARGI
jgi:hypothetical protein